MTSEKLRDIYTLKCITRYNTRRHLKDESVAEHSFYVALISLMLCDEYHIDSETTKQAIIKALLHDMPEIEINDITHDAKEKLNLRPYLKKYEDDFYRRKFPEYSNLMICNTGIASTIVDIADAMSVWQYVDNEQSLGNMDKDISTIKESCMPRVDAGIEKLKRQLKRKQYETNKTSKDDTI